MEKIETRNFLGLPRQASHEEIEIRCEELLEWLEAGNVPENLRFWASRQATIIREIYESLTPEEETEAATEGSEGITLSIETTEETTKKVPLAREGGAPVLSRIGSSPLTFVAVGVLLGLSLIGALWWRGVIFNKGGATAAQVQQQEQSAQKAEQYLKSQQGRIEELEKVLAANPKDPNALFELGEIYTTGNSWENSIYWFTKLLEVDPNNLHARTDIGTANMSLGRYGEAITAFNQVLAVDPSEVRTHYNLGFLYAFRTDAPDPAQALKHWREVIRLAPDSDLSKVAQVHIDQFKSAASKPASLTPTGK